MLPGACAYQEASSLVRARERSPPHSPEGGRSGRPPIARNGSEGTGRCCSRGDVVPMAAGRSPLRRLGRLGTWFRSDEGPPLTPEQEAERWGRLFGCGY